VRELAVDIMPLREKRMNVPLKVDIKTGVNWGEMERATEG
jgi:DNA polymerase I-like protein with 3'-5' exonuclease and polymerase domains